VVYGVALRDGLRRLAHEILPGPLAPDVSLAADRVLSALPLDLQIAIMVAWMKTVVLVHEAIHRRPQSA
jgi:hypothetical protein